jgi:putative tributyrin esterase
MKNIVTLVVLSFFMCLSATAAKVDTVFVQSAKMNQKVGVVVITPSNSTSKKTKFPVLYLLHGMGDKYPKWISTVPQIKDLADQYQLMIVCPDGGINSMYLDSPIVPSSQYETFLSTELIDYIDKNYSTIANKKGRIITGLSMGGHGALYLAMMHPDKYVAAGSMSGATDTWRLGFEDWAVKQIGQWIGPFKDNEATWRKYSVLHNIALLRNTDLKLYIDCGTEDFLLDDNRELHRRLNYERIPHEYVERPGGHTWDYWANAIKYQVAYLQQFLVR